MASKAELVELIHDLKSQCVRVFFSDGEIYDLKIVSTMHAQEGGDVVAYAISKIDSKPSIIDWRHNAMNLHLDDIVRIERDSSCLYSK